MSLVTLFFVSLLFEVVMQIAAIEELPVTFFFSLISLLSLFSLPSLSNASLVGFFFYIFILTLLKIGLSFFILSEKFVKFHKKKNFFFFFLNFLKKFLFYYSFI